MNQRLVSDHFPYLPIAVEAGGQVFRFEALLDTGFDGAVLVPRDLFDGLQITARISSWLLADGSRVTAPAYDALARLGDLVPVAVTVIALGDEPLIGRTLIRHVLVHLDHGRRVTVEPSARVPP